MTKIILMRGVTLVMWLGLLVGLIGCGDEKDETDIDFTVGYTHLHVGYSKQHDLDCMVKNFSDWRSIRNEREYLSDLDDKYDEHFFASNSLIVHAFTKGRGINQLEIGKIKNNGNDIFVNIEITLGVMEVISCGIVIIEVAKTSIASAKKINIVEK